MMFLDLRVVIRVLVLFHVKLFCEVLCSVYCSETSYRLFLRYFNIKFIDLQTAIMNASRLAIPISFHT